MYFSERIERIVGCLGTQHDLRLVVLAALICLFSCFTASGLIQRTREATSDRAWPWLAAAAGVFSCGVWATHFIAELAYAPGLPIGFGSFWTILSLVIAGAVATVIAAIIVAAQVAVHIDMRLTKTALAKSYSTLASALETLPAGIALFDQSDRLVAFNATYARIHATIADILTPGITFETILRQNVRRSRFELGEEGQEAYVARRLAQHRNPSDAFERRLVDGRWERVEEQRMADGGLSLVITDITRDKEREAALLMAKDVADAANSAKSSFLANMRHGSPPPPNAILGSADAMTLSTSGPT